MKLSDYKNYRRTAMSCLEEESDEILDDLYDFVYIGVLKMKMDSASFKKHFIGNHFSCRVKDIVVPHFNQNYVKLKMEEECWSNIGSDKITLTPADGNRETSPFIIAFHNFGAMKKMLQSIIKDNKTLIYGTFHKCKRFKEKQHHFECIDYFPFKIDEAHGYRKLGLNSYSDNIKFSIEDTDVLAIKLMSFNSPGGFNHCCLYDVEWGMFK